MCEMEAETTVHIHPVEYEKKGNNNYQSESWMQNLQIKYNKRQEVMKFCSIPIRWRQKSFSPEKTSSKL